MTAYYYIKRQPRIIIRSYAGLLPPLFLSSGLFLLALVVWPIVSFQLLFFSKNTAMISPIPDRQVLGTQTDLTQVSNWFVSSSQRTTPSKISSYTLSIPKLGIKEAVVIIGSEDLSKSLIQWGGTAMPGEYGNTVIFGHSVLPAFFNPKNYTTIFSTLPTLKEKDEINIYFDGITYHYQIMTMDVIEAQDLSVLEQKFDDSYLSLITCVPPGTYWKRLVVKARLVKI